MSVPDQPSNRIDDTSGSLARIARHLHVPISTFFHPDVRIGQRHHPAAPSTDAAELVRLYAGLDPEGRACLLALARRLGSR